MSEREVDSAGSKDLRNEDEGEFRVNDRRHWQHAEDAEDTDESEVEEVQPARPSVVEEYRQRAETAEEKLLEYVSAYKEHKREQDELRERLSRDVERRVQLQFGELVTELLDAVDDLELALSHVRGIPEAEPLAQGVAMARDRFLSSLERHGVTRLVPADRFDPVEAEAVRVDPVDSAEADGSVTETLKPGYRIGERVLRAAQVAVGRFKK